MSIFLWSIAGCFIGTMIGHIIWYIVSDWLPTYRELKKLIKEGYLK